jgi:hypothetical protein
MIKRASKPVIEACGCWQCKECKGQGHSNRMEGAKEIREDCAACEGWGHMKLCATHALMSEWIEKGRRK